MKRPLRQKSASTLAKLKDKDIDFSDIPELPEDFWKFARVLKPVSKKMITLRVDDDMLSWFRKKGHGYQAHMNAILRAYFETQQR